MDTFIEKEIISPNETKYITKCLRTGEPVFWVTITWLESPLPRHMIESTIEEAMKSGIDDGCDK